MDKKYYLGVNVKTSGQFLSENFIIALGMVVLDTEGKKVDSFLGSMFPWMGAGWEQQAKDGFWKNHINELNNYANNAQTPMDVMNYAVLWLDDIDLKYGTSLEVLSYNPSYAVAWINLYLSLFTTRPSLYYRYCTEEKRYKYRSIIDTRSVMIGVCFGLSGQMIHSNIEETLEISNSVWKADHDVLTDAAKIAADYILLVNKFINKKM